MTIAFYYLVVLLLLYCVYLTRRLGEVMFFLDTLYEKTINIEIDKRIDYILCQNREKFDAEKFVEKFKKN